MISCCLIGVALTLPAARGASTVPQASDDTVPVSASPDPARLPPLRLADPPARLVPLRRRTDGDLDRLESETRYAHARLLYQRGDHAGALRQYQRSFRLRPAAAGLVAEVVPLAVQLRRPAVAARYAAMATAEDPLPNGLLRQLALYLTEEEDHAEATRLYELILKKGQEQKKDPSRVFSHYELGRLYFLTENYPRSAASFEVVRAALEDPAKFGLGPSMRKLLLGDASVTYTIMAESFLQSGSPLRAAALFRAANDAQPNEPLLSFHLARVAEVQGHVAQARQKLDEYFEAKLSSAGTEPYKLLERLARNDHPGPATMPRLRERLENLFREDPKNAPLGYFLANFYRTSKNSPKAKRLYVQLSKTAPTVEGYRALVDLYRRDNQVDQLVGVLGEVVDRTGNLQSMDDVVSALLGDTERVDQIISTSRSRIDSPQTPLSSPAAAAVALIAIGGGKFDVAEEFFELALRRDPPDPVGLLSTWGVELFLAGQYDRSATVLRRALQKKVKPETTTLLQFYLAAALELAGKTEEALVAADVAAGLNPQSPILQGRRGWILDHAGQNAQAETEYRKLLKRFDSDHRSPDAREAMRDTRSALSNLCVLRDALDEAEEWLQQILDEFPNDTGAMNDLGYLWADQNKLLHRALEMVSRAVQDRPDNVAFRDSLGWTLFRLGRYDESVRELEKAAGGEAPDGIILDHLGDAYNKIGNVSAALTSWRKAIETLQRDQQPQRIADIQVKIQQHRSE